MWSCGPFILNDYEGKVLTAFEAMDELSQKARIDIPQGLKELRGLPEPGKRYRGPGRNGKGSQEDSCH